MTPEASEDEALIVVLERCRALCSQYGIQTDFQLGAIHQPGSRAGQGPSATSIPESKKKRTSLIIRRSPLGIICTSAAGAVGTSPQVMPPSTAVSLNGAGNDRRFLRLRLGRFYPQLGGEKCGIHDFGAAFGQRFNKIKRIYLSHYTSREIYADGVR